MKLIIKKHDKQNLEFDLTPDFFLEAHDEKVRNSYDTMFFECDKNESKYSKRVQLYSSSKKEMQRWFSDLKKYVTLCINSSMFRIDSETRTEAIEQYYKKFNEHNVSADRVWIEFGVDGQRQCTISYNNDFKGSITEIPMFYSNVLEFSIGISDNVFLQWDRDSDFSDWFDSVVKVLK